MDELSTPVPAIGSVLLASTDPDRLRAWYERAFGVSADADGFLRLGGVGLLVDGRDDVAAETAEPARVILNVHVGDAQETARQLDAMTVTWVAELGYREQAGAWFGTVLDPDGNYVQIIELTGAYWAARRQRAWQAGHGPLAGAAVSTRLPASDLDRARRFYADKLGLEPTETRPGGRSTTSMRWSPNCAGAAWCSSGSTSPGCAPSTGSPRSKATTRPPGVAESGPPGSATAKATCTASASRSAGALQRLADPPPAA